MYREDRPETVSVHYGNLAHTYELMGEYELAANYRRLSDESNKNEGTMMRLTADYARSGQMELAKKLIGDFACGREQKEFMLYRAYLYAGMPNQAFRCISRTKKFLAGHAAFASVALGHSSRYFHIVAWDFMLNGKKKEGLKAIDQAFTNFRDSYRRKKEKLDTVLNRIFFLTFQEGKIEADLFDTQKEEEDRTSAAMKAALRDLKETVELFSWGNPTEGEDSGLIATKEFFYKERYVKFIEFLLALYGKGNEPGEEALKIMEESPRCRLCNQASCMRLTIARALLLEQQEKKQEAVELYQKLLEKQPYNLYAIAKLAEFDRTSSS